MEHSDTSASLLCEEDETCLNEREYEYKDICYNPCFVSEDEDEYIEKLVQKETSFGYASHDDCVTISRNWFKCARSDAIDWILNTGAIFGFHFHTIYQSVIYFDRFLSKRSIDNGKFWAIRLLSVACLSLAAKMEESKVPALSEFQAEDYDFENKVIQRMELLVLNTLEWKMGSITPFAYLHYFIKKLFCEPKIKELYSRTVELIMTVTKEINLIDHRPSIIAVAAVLAASDSQLTRKSVELKMSTISSCSSLENELVMGKFNTPKLVISPNLTSTHSSSTDVLEKTSFTSAIGAKRRLPFNDSDQNCLEKKIHRP